MTPRHTIAQRQAAWVANLEYDSIPREVIALAKLCLLDFLGVALRGSLLPQISPVTPLLQAIGDSAAATVIGGQSTSVPYAALANGTFGHSCEFDDSHIHGGHPGVCVIPAAIAAGEVQKINGKGLLTAIIAGYQVMINSVGPIHRRTLDLGWHGTKVGGVFGAAAAVGKILKLPELQLAHALAIAGSDASGTMEYDQSGGEIKRFHAGFASRSGAEAALLAAAGLTGPLTIFEGKRGIHRLFSEGREPDMSRYSEESFHILETMFKLHPCAGTLHAAIDCVAKIQTEHHITAKQVDLVEVELVDWAIPHGAAIVEPTDVISAQFSLAFSLGLQLVRGATSIDDYLNAEMWNNQEIMEIAHKVRPVATPVPNGAEELFAVVSLVTTEGKIYSASQIAPRGFPTLPASITDLKEKFLSLTNQILPLSQANALLDAIDHLEELSDTTFITNAFQSVE